MQQVKTPDELDDIALLNRLCPPDPTQPPAESTVEHLSAAEAEAIFQREEAALQPLLRRMRRDTFVQNTLEVVCWLCILASLVGIVYQLITYPHTLIILYTKAIPASTTATLDLPTRPLAPITLTRSATRATTGTGHQDATRATGTLTFIMVSPPCNGCQRPS